MTWLARHGAWKKLFLMTHILQYRAARARQDSLADNLKILKFEFRSLHCIDCSSPKKLVIGLFGERLQRPLVSAWIKGHGWADAEEEADSTLLWNGSNSSNSSYFFF